MSTINKRKATTNIVKNTKKKVVTQPNFLTHEEDPNFSDEAYYDPSLVTEVLNHLIFRRPDTGSDDEEYDQNLSKLKGLLTEISNESGVHEEVISTLINGLMDKLVQDIKKDDELYKKLCYDLIIQYVNGVSYCANFYLYKKGNVSDHEIDAVSASCAVTLPDTLIYFLDRYTVGLFLKEGEDLPPERNDMYGPIVYYFFNPNNSSVREIFNIKYSIDKYVQLFNLQFNNGPFTKVLQPGTILYRGVQLPPDKAVNIFGKNDSYLSTSSNMDVAIEHATDVYGDARGNLLKKGSSTLIQYNISGQVPTIDLSLAEDYYMTVIAPTKYQKGKDALENDFLYTVTGLQKNKKNNAIIKQKGQEFLNSEKGQEETTQVKKKVAELVDPNLPFDKNIEQNYRFSTLGIWQEEFIAPIGCESQVINNNFEDVPMPKSVASYTPNNDATIKKINASLSYPSVGGRKQKHNTRKNKKYKKKYTRKM